MGVHDCPRLDHGCPYLRGFPGSAYDNVYYSEHFENQVSSKNQVHVNNKYRQIFKLLLKMFLLLTEMLADVIS